MKFLIILSLFALTSCSSYTVSKISDQQIMISKQTEVLGLFGGSVLTCDLDKEGMISVCDSNEIQTAEEIEKRQEQINKENERKAKNNINQKEEVQEVKVKKADNDLSKIYIGLGISNAGIEPKYKEVETAFFNYSLAYLLKAKESMFGLIYHVSAYRQYGYMDLGDNKKEPFELQANLNLLGISYRRYATSTRETSPYLRLDGGLAWATTGTSVLLSPLENSFGAGIGANIGAGMSVKTSFGSINIDLYQTIYNSPDTKIIDSGVTNFTLGVMF